MPSQSCQRWCSARANGTSPWRSAFFVAPVRVVAQDVALTDSGEVRIIEVNEIGARFFQVATGGWLADAELADALKSTDSLACWIQRTI